MTGYLKPNTSRNNKNIVLALHNNAMIKIIVETIYNDVGTKFNNTKSNFTYNCYMCQACGFHTYVSVVLISRVVWFITESYTVIKLLLRTESFVTTQRGPFIRKRHYKRILPDQLLRAQYVYITWSTREITNFKGSRKKWHRNSYIQVSSIKLQRKS